MRDGAVAEILAMVAILLVSVAFVLPSTMGVAPVLSFEEAVVLILTNMSGLIVDP